jgi:hypothetical protein
VPAKVAHLHGCGGLRLSCGSAGGERLSEHLDDAVFG